MESEEEMFPQSWQIKCYLISGNAVKQWKYITQQSRNDFGNGVWISGIHD